MATKSLFIPQSLSNIPPAELSSVISAFKGATPPAGNSSPREEIDHPEFDAYRIALISPQNSEALADLSPHRHAKAGRLVVLPLTWKELITRVRREIATSSFSDGSKVVQFGRVRVEL